MPSLFFEGVAELANNAFILVGGDVNTRDYSRTRLRSAIVQPHQNIFRKLRSCFWPTRDSAQLRYAPGKSTQILWLT